MLEGEKVVALLSGVGTELDTRGSSKLRQTLYNHAIVPTVEGMQELVEHYPGSHLVNLKAGQGVIVPAGTPHLAYNVTRCVSLNTSVCSSTEGLLLAVRRSLDHQHASSDVSLASLSDGFVRCVEQLVASSLVRAGNASKGGISTCQVSHTEYIHCLGMLVELSHIIPLMVRVGANDTWFQRWLSKIRSFLRDPSADVLLL